MRSLVKAGAGYIYCIFVWVRCFECGVRVVGGRAKERVCVYKHTYAPPPNIYIASLWIKRGTDQNWRIQKDSPDT